MPQGRLRVADFDMADETFLRLLRQHRPERWRPHAAALQHSHAETARSGPNRSRRTRTARKHARRWAQHHPHHPPDETRPPPCAPRTGQDPTLRHGVDDLPARIIDGPRAAVTARRLQDFVTPPA